MTANETAARPQRRVGTFTLGFVLIAAGCGMLASLLRPGLDLRWMLSAAPLILIALGVETLLAARGGGRVRYDWLGMLLSFLLVGSALAMYAAAWCFANVEYFNAYDCSRYADETSYRMDYQHFDGYDSHTLRLRAGDVLEGSVDTRSGWLEVEISGSDGHIILEEAPLNGDQRFEIDRSGDYTILVHGQRASGGFRFTVQPRDEAPPQPEAPPPQEQPSPEA